MRFHVGIADSLRVDDFAMLRNQDRALDVSILFVACNQILDPLRLAGRKILRRAAARCSQEHHHAHGPASSKHAGEDTNAGAQKSISAFLAVWTEKTLAG
jgi:hypothetical protein